MCGLIIGHHTVADSFAKQKTKTCMVNPRGHEMMGGPGPMRLGGGWWWRRGGPGVQYTPVFFRFKIEVTTCVTLGTCAPGT